jgi:hypothetical protein
MNDLFKVILSGIFSRLFPAPQRGGEVLALMHKLVLCPRPELAEIGHVSFHHVEDPHQVSTLNVCRPQTFPELSFPSG